MSQHSWYHITLRVVAATLGAAVLFSSGVVSPLTADLAKQAQHYLATAVGVDASVAPNELNTITARLTERERELDEREAALEQRQIDVGLNQGAAGSTNSPDYSTYIMSSVLFILLVLIVLNYALDFARSRREAAYVRAPSKQQQA